MDCQSIWFIRISSLHQPQKREKPTKREETLTMAKHNTMTTALAETDSMNDGSVAERTSNEERRRESTECMDRVNREEEESIFKI